MTRRMGRIVGAALVLLVSSTLAVSLASHSDATEAAARQQADAQLRLVAPESVPGMPGRLVVVDVQVSTARATRGVVVIESRQFGGGPSSATYSVPVELAASTPVTFSLTVPSGFDGVNLDARLLVDGAEVADAELRRFPDSGAAEVGLLGVEGDDRISYSVGEGSATTHVVTPQRIETAGLHGLATLVVSPAALRELPETSLAIVLGFVASGGDLSVVGSPGSIDEVLPPDWRATAGQVVATAGLGRVVYGENWTDRLAPSGVFGAVTGPEVDPFAVIGDMPADAVTDLASDAGLSLPELRTLGILLGIYVLVAGPVVYFVLKRLDRTHLAWVALPVVAIVFSVGSLIVGSDLRSDRGNSHVTIVEVWPAGSRATTSTLVTSARQDTRTLSLPPGWVYAGPGNTFGGGVGQSAAISIEPARTGARFGAEMPAGGAATAQFVGPTPQFDGALEIVDIVRDGESVAATVMNRSGVDLVEAVAFFGNEAVEIGDVADGESLSFTVDFSDNRAQRLREFSIWPTARFFGDQVRTANTSTSSGVWAQWRASQGWNTFPAGVVGVAGWTRELSSPTTGVSQGRTAFVVRAPLPPADADGVPLSRTVVADPASSQSGVGGDGFFFSHRFVVRVDVPPSLAASQVAVEVARPVAGLEFWNGEHWIPVTLSEGGIQTVGVDPAWLIDGHVWVRSTTPEWEWPPRPGVHAVVGTAPLAEKREVGDAISRNNQGGPFEEFGEFEAEVGESITLELSTAEVVEVEGDLFGPEYDEYVVMLEEGDELTLRLSAEHDSLLRVRDPDGRQIAENDDFGQCCNSGLTFTAESAGDYVIEARELGNSGRGDYLLTVERNGGGT